MLDTARLSEDGMSTSADYDVQVQAGAGIWTPQSSVTDHLGGQLTPDRDFFVAPPREIGAVETAYSSLKRGVEAKSMQTRITIVAVAAAAGVGAGVGLDYLTGIHTPLWPVILASVAALIAWGVTRFKHFSNFVGSEGCAEFKCKGVPENITEKQVFYFKDAWAVSTSITRHFTNGVYSGTSFGFYWYPHEGGKAVYKIAGRHRANLKTPPLGNAYNFARAVEVAWINYLIPKLDAELSQKGYINFYMGDKRWARLGRGFLDIVEKDGNVNRCESGDIGSAKLASGVFTLTRKDAKSKFFGLLGSSGVFRFNYGIMYNARLFLFAFQKLLNIKVE